MGFHGNQPNYNPGHPQTSPQLSGNNGGGGSLHMAKWHIPQSAQGSSTLNSFVKFLLILYCFILLQLVPNKALI